MGRQSGGWLLSEDSGVPGLGRNSLQVPGAVLRCGTGTAYFHENLKTYHPVPSAVGHSMRALPRRHFNYRFVSREEHSAVSDGSQPAGTLGLYHLPQVVSGSFKNTGFLGDDNRLAPDGTSGSTREGSKIQTVVKQSLRLDDQHRLTLRQLAGVIGKI